jgi:hypothetical protein
LSFFLLSMPLFSFLPERARGTAAPVRSVPST